MKNQITLAVKALSPHKPTIRSAIRIDGVYIYSDASVTIDGSDIACVSRIVHVGQPNSPEELNAITIRQDEVLLDALSIAGDLYLTASIDVSASDEELCGEVSSGGVSHSEDAINKESSGEVIITENEAHSETASCENSPASASSFDDTNGEDSAVDEASVDTTPYDDSNGEDNSGEENLSNGRSDNESNAEKDSGNDFSGVNNSSKETANEDETAQPDKAIGKSDNQDETITAETEDKNETILGEKRDNTGEVGAPKKRGRPKKENNAEANDDLKWANETILAIKEGKENAVPPGLQLFVGRPIAEMVAKNPFLINFIIDKESGRNCVSDEVLKAARVIRNHRQKK